MMELALLKLARLHNVAGFMMELALLKLSRLQDVAGIVEAIKVA